jgi:hypothetical protein
VYGRRCNCQYGASSYTPSASCTTSDQCTHTCYWGYSVCINGYTKGCCGSLACPSYAGEEIYNDPGTCICQCSSSLTGSSYEQGRASSSMCASSTCQYLYPSTCGTYKNQAYCSNVINHHQTAIFIFIFFIIGTVYFV